MHESQHAETPKEIATGWLAVAACVLGGMAVKREAAKIGLGRPLSILLGLGATVAGLATAAHFLVNDTQESQSSPRRHHIFEM